MQTLQEIVLGLEHERRTSGRTPQEIAARATVRSQDVGGDEPWVLGFITDAQPPGFVIDNGVREPDDVFLARLLNAAGARLRVETAEYGVIDVLLSRCVAEGGYIRATAERPTVMPYTIVRATVGAGDEELAVLREMAGRRVLNGDSLGVVIDVRP